MTTLEQLETARTAVQAAQVEMRHWFHDEECDYDEERPEETCTCGLALVQTHLKAAAAALQALITTEGNNHGSTND
ncbi:MAG: hypothetical protein HS126_37065 [Anaerolineales bacterium]|nr:hypothetical protein [Anaerolineales bacterium]